MTGNFRHGEPVDESLAIGPFRVDYAVGPAPRIAEYRLRYDAFVEERRWESADACHDRLERDEFDRFCCSTLITDTATGAAAACQRLILPEHLPHGQLTRAEREYRPLPSVPAIDFKGLKRDAWAEVSRLTIAPRYRWGSAKTSLPAMVGITYASIALAVALERTVLFTVSDPRTARLTRRMGFELHQVGQFVDCHGRRGIFRIDVAEVMASVDAPWLGIVNQLIERARVETGAAAWHPEASPYAA